ncbi:MAG: glycosyltransferase family 2 protein [Patescibacteria group bacterium]
MLSIVIVNYKNPALLRLCLGSLVRELSPHFDYEVVVVDSQTSVETQNVVREEFTTLFKKITLVPYRENTGYTRGNNEGMRKSSGDHFLILNPDAMITKGSVKRLYEYLVAHPQVGLLGPQLLDFNGTRQQSCFRFYSIFTILYRRVNHLPFANRILNRFLMRDADLSKTIPVDWLMGSALMTSRAAVQRVGLMDERMFHYFSEVDWARRFWENGYAVTYFPHAQMYHYHRRQSKGRFGIFDIIMQRESRWHLMDGIRYFLKYGFSTARPSYAHHGTA